MTEKSSENFRPFKWKKPQEDAAVLLAEDELTDAEIGERVGVTDRQLRTWKQHPEFAAKVNELAKGMGDQCKRYAVGRKGRRLQGYDERRRKLLTVIEERAGDSRSAHVPGWKTGLLVRTVKSIGSGAGSREVEEFTVDTGILKELRELEKQAAVEAGQWTEKREHNVPADIDTLIAAELMRLARPRQGTGAGETSGSE